jgi:hypothetical protein
VASLQRARSSSSATLGSEERRETQQQPRLPAFIGFVFSREQHESGSGLRAGLGCAAIAARGFNPVRTISARGVTLRCVPWRP